MHLKFFQIVKIRNCYIYQIVEFWNFPDSWISKFSESLNFQIFILVNLTGRGRRKATESTAIVKQEPYVLQDDNSSQGIQIGTLKNDVKLEDSGVGVTSQSIEIDNLDWTRAWDQSQHYHHQEHQHNQQQQHHHSNSYQSILQISGDRSNNGTSQLDSPPRRVKTEVLPMNKYVIFVSS